MKQPAGQPQPQTCLSGIGTEGAVVVNDVRRPGLATEEKFVASSISVRCINERPRRSVYAELRRSIAHHTPITLEAQTPPHPRYSVSRAARSLAAFARLTRPRRPAIRGK